MGGNLVMIFDECFHFGSWPLRVVGQVTSSSDILERTVNVKTTKGTLTCDV